MINFYERMHEEEPSQSIGWQLTASCESQWHTNNTYEGSRLHCTKADQHCRSVEFRHRDTSVEVDTRRGIELGPVEALKAVGKDTNILIAI